MVFIPCARKAEFTKCSKVLLYVNQVVLADLTSQKMHGLLYYV